MPELTGADLWEVYRLELVFLNPQEHRWQMFQHHPSDTHPQERKIDAVYRRHAKDLLRWVGKTIQELGFQTPPLQARKVTLWPHVIRTQLLRLAAKQDRDDPQAFIEDFISRYRAHTLGIIAAEGLEESVADWIDQLCAGTEPVTLSKEAPFELASALFIANHWDVFGRLSFKRGPPEDVNLGRVTSFGYVITYENEDDDNNPVGYPVYLQVLPDPLADAPKAAPAEGQTSQEVARHSLGVPVTHEKGGLPEKLPKQDPRRIFGTLMDRADYFDHCHPIAADDEQLWYCVYGLVIDEINKAGAGLEGAPVKDAPVYVRCFPLRICGYDHFLQVLVRPMDQRGVPEALPPIFPRALPHADSDEPDVVCLPVVKECLRELIVQMHVAAFQKHVIDALYQRRLDPTSIEELELFAEHAPNLVRMDGLWVRNHAYYSYGKRKAEPFESWRKSEGAPAPPPEALALDHHYAVVADGRIIAHVPWEGDFDHLGPLLGGTGQQRLEEQWEWLMLYLERWRNAREMETHLAPLSRIATSLQNERRRAHGPNPAEA